MIEISTKQLEEILFEHRLWLASNGDKGKRANLQWVDLQGVDLQGVDLREAYLQGVDLQGAYLQRADLRDAYLQEAGLQGADLRETVLRGADLQGVDLQGVDLQGVDLRGVDLRGADLRGADLRGADLRGADLRGVKNADYARINQTQRAIFELTDDTEYAVAQLQLQIKQAKQAGKDELVPPLEDKLKKATIKQHDKSQDTKLEEAIQKISKANKDGSNMLSAYKANSTLLMWFGIFLFILAIMIAAFVYCTKIYSADINSLSSFHLVLFSPSFVLAFIGTALLRHDWKIRQLTQQLITQNSHIDIATGILTASLNLTRIDNIEKEELSILRDSFTSVRQALLFKENNQPVNNQGASDKEGDLSASIKTLSRYIKNI